MFETPVYRRRFHAPWVLFWVAFALRVLAILVGRTYHVNPVDNHFDFGFEAGRIAQSLVTGHGYANPFNGYSGPTAWLPPLYPLLMALAFKLFGVYSAGSALFIMVCDSVFSAAIAPAIYEIAARCFDARHLVRRASTRANPVALWSGWLWAAYPAALQYAVHWIWEMSLSTFLFTWTFVLALRLRRVGEPAENDPGAPTLNPRRDLRLWAGFGLLWGLVALSNATLLICLPAVMLWIGWPQLKHLGNRAAIERTLAGALLSCVVLAATMTPWIVRNERALHAFIPTRSNLGVELWQSSRFASFGSFPWGTAMPLWPGAPEFRAYVLQGEVAYAHRKGDLARHTLLTHKRLLARYTLLRIQHFWFGVPHPTEKHPSNEFFRILNFSFTSVAGLLGLALALKRRVPAAWLLAWPLLLVPLVYYVVTVQARFRHPIEPFITILAVYLFRSTGKRTEPQG